MEAPIIIEILDRFGKVRERHKITQLPARIGRSYRNDIIIDDPFVSPEHIEIMQDGGGHVMITDLKSENGVFTLHPITKHDIIAVEENQRIRLGHTDIRIRSESWPVKETVIDHGKPSQLHFMMTNILSMPIIFVLLAAILAGDQYVQTVTEVNTNQIIGAILPVLIIVVLWALVWSIISKVITHSFYFAYHAIVVCGLLSAFYFIETSFEYIEFNFPHAGLDGYLTIVSDLAFTILLLYGHLRQSTHFTRRKTRYVSTITAGLVVGVAYLIAFVNEPQYESSPVFSGIMKPPAFAVTPATTASNFFEQTHALSVFDIPTQDK